MVQILCLLWRNIKLREDFFIKKQGPFSSLFSYKMRNFYKDFYLFFNNSLLEKKGKISLKRENTLKNGPRKRWSPLGPFVFVPSGYHRFNNNEHQICSKWWKLM